MRLPSQHIKALFFGLGLGLLCLFCTLPTGARSIPLYQALSGFHWQQICLGESCFHLALANTPLTQQQGLMHQSNLKPNEGMRFVFSHPARYAFWMKHCLIPLDFVYIRQGQIVEMKAQVPPCLNKQETCPSFQPSQPVDEVIELKAGSIEAQGLKIGAPRRIRRSKRHPSNQGKVPYKRTIEPTTKA